MWTDRKNLEYLRTARRLNPHQARWALFFSFLNFSLGCDPVSTLKMLSLGFDPVSTLKTPSYFLPAPCLVRDITWGIEEKVTQAGVNVNVR